MKSFRFATIHHTPNQLASITNPFYNSNVISRLITRLVELFSTLKTRPNLQAMALLAFWSLASRGLGALRILLIGRFTTQHAEVFNAAFVLPDNIIAIFIAGSITVAFLPHIIELHETEKSNNTEGELSREKEAIYFSYVSILLSVVIGFISIACIIFADPLLRLLNENLYYNLKDLGEWDLYLTLTRILLIAPLIFAVKTVFGAFLNARRAFAVFATDGVITNIGIIFGLTVLYAMYGVIGAVWGVIIGFALSALAFGIDAFRHGMRFRLGKFDGLRGYLVKTFVLYFPRLLIIPAIRIAETMVTITTNSADGQISILKTALDLQGIPLGMVTVAAVVFLPDITTIFVKSGYADEFKSLLKKYLIWGSLFSFLGFIGLSISTPIIFWILDKIGFIEPNSFFDSSENIRLIWICTVICSASLVFQTMVELYIRVYVAVKNSSIPLISSLFGNCIGIVFTVLTADYFGAAVATALGFSMNAIIQSMIAVYFFPIVGRRTIKNRQEVL